MNKCLCIKDGYMTSGSQFCKYENVYEYEIDSDMYYIVNSDVVDSDIGEIHHMPKDFFNEYFIVLVNESMMNKFESEEFEI